MWRTPWPWSTVVLSLALIVLARRLSDVQVELERARAQDRVDRTTSSERAHSVNGRTAQSVNGHPVWSASDSSEVCAEWEQVLPPMDS
jgi:hypothetical protein